MRSYAIDTYYKKSGLNVLKIHSIDENHGFNSNKIFYIIYFLISSIILLNKILRIDSKYDNNKYIINHIIQLIFWYNKNLSLEYKSITNNNKNEYSNLKEEILNLKKTRINNKLLILLSKLLGY